MRLEDFLDKYIVIRKRNGKYVRGLLVTILNSDETLESDGFITLVVRQDDGKYKNVHLIEVETIGEVE